MTRGLAIIGHGKMGRLVEQLAPEYGFDVRLALNSGTNACGAGITREHLCGVEVAVEFSTPSSAVQNIRQLVSLGVPIVAGTTGWFPKRDFPDLTEDALSLGYSRDDCRPTGPSWNVNRYSCLFNTGRNRYY